MDLGGGAVVGVAESSDEGQDVEAELVVRQGEPALGLGPVGPQAQGAVGGVAAADAQGEPEDAVEPGDGAVVGVVGAGGALAVRAGDGYGREGLGLGRAGSWGSACHEGSLLL